MIRNFKTDEFIKDIISSLKVTFGDTLKIFVEKIEKETPRYLFLYLTGDINPNKGLTNSDEYYDVRSQHDLTLNIIYRDNNGTINNLYEINDKICENLILYQHKITKAYVNNINYEVFADAKGIMLNIKAQFNFLTHYYEKYDEGIIKDLKIVIKNKNEGVI